MRWTWIVGLVMAAGCDLYFPPQPTPPPPQPGPGQLAGPDAGPPDASLDDPACGGRIGCGTGRHCEVQCTQYGPPGCIYNCHATCVPDQGCTTIMTCAPGTVCAETCSNECQGMADLCQLTCTASPGACETLGEGDCLANSACQPVYHASGCTCPGLVTCTCSDETATFARCMPAS